MQPVLGTSSDTCRRVRWHEPRFAWYATLTGASHRNWIGITTVKWWTGLWHVSKTKHDSRPSFRFIIHNFSLERHSLHNFLTQYIIPVGYTAAAAVNEPICFPQRTRNVYWHHIGEELEEADVSSHFLKVRLLFPHFLKRTIVSHFLYIKS
jgi:hypothetical protein